VIPTDVGVSGDGPTKFLTTMLNAATDGRKPQLTTANDA
jgi:hypothetical protein